MSSHFSSLMCLLYSLYGFPVYYATATMSFYIQFSINKLIVPNIFSLDSFSVVKKLCSSTKAINAALLAFEKRYLNYWQLMILLMKMFKSRRNGFFEKNVCWLTKSCTMKTFTLRTFINKDRSRWNDHIEGNANCNPTTFFKCL